jgi:hypothetical protein
MRRDSLEDIGIELEHIKSEVENSIPSSFYGSFVLVLYAELESAISDVAEYVRKKESAHLSLHDLREPNSLKRLSLYLETLMKQRLNAPSDITQFLQQLQVVRTMISSCNHLDLTLRCRGRCAIKPRSAGYFNVRPQPSSFSP